MTVQPPLRKTMGEVVAETRKRALDDAARLASEIAHDYEGDWSSPEFNFAADVARKIRELALSEEEPPSSLPCPRCSGTGRRQRGPA